MTGSVRIGWIGVGKMGLPMATHLLRAGHRVCAYDPQPGGVDALAARGGERASRLADAVRDADVTFSSLPDDTALRAVALSEHGVLAAARKGAVLVDVSTVSPQSSAEVAAAAAKRGVHYDYIATVKLAERLAGLDAEPEH